MWHRDRAGLKRLLKAGAFLKMLDPASPVIQQQNPCQDEVRGAPQHFHPVPPFFHTAGRVWEGPFPALRMGSARKSSGNGTFLMPSDVSRHLPGAGGVLFLLSPPPSPEGAKDRVRKCPWGRNWDQGTQREPFAAVPQPAPKENPFPHSAGPSLSPMAASAPLGAPQPHHNCPGPGTGRKGLNRGPGWGFVHLSLPSSSCPLSTTSNTRIPCWSHGGRDCLPKSSRILRATSPQLQGSLEEPIPALSFQALRDPGMLLQPQVPGNAVAARQEHG